MTTVRSFEMSFTASRAAERTVPPPRLLPYLVLGLMIGALAWLAGRRVGAAVAQSLAGRGFRVVEAYSRIVRLGEGLSQSGRLSEEAMDRALAALKVSGEKVRRRRVVKFRAIATQACRIAENGQAFVNRVANETGVKLQIITPQEEAKLSVTGCLNLLDYRQDAALVVDVGGGSTELSWVDLKAATPGAPPVAA